MAANGSVSRPCRQSRRLAQNRRAVPTPVLVGDMVGDPLSPVRSSLRDRRAGRPVRRRVIVIVLSGPGSPRPRPVGVTPYRSSVGWPELPDRRGWTGGRIVTVFGRVAARGGPWPHLPRNIYQRRSRPQLPLFGPHRPAVRRCSAPACAHIDARDGTRGDLVGSFLGIARVSFTAVRPSVWPPGRCCSVCCAVGTTGRGRPAKNRLALRSCCCHRWCCTRSRSPLKRLTRTPVALADRRPAVENLGILQRWPVRGL